MGFVGNYAPCGLSPQTDGMPVILKKRTGTNLIPVLLFIHIRSVSSLLHNGYHPKCRILHFDS